MRWRELEFEVLECLHQVDEFGEKTGCLFQAAFEGEAALLVELLLGIEVLHLWFRILWGWRIRESQIRCWLICMSLLARR